MSNPKDSVSNLLLIKRAKRRLVGSIVILIILFSLSIFFVKTKTEAIKSNPKISFLETTQPFAVAEKILDESEGIIFSLNEDLAINDNSQKKKALMLS